MIIHYKKKKTLAVCQPQPGGKHQYSIVPGPQPGSRDALW